MIVFTTFAGAIAFVINISGFSSQTIISIFSPLSSFTMLEILVLLGPIQAPTGSTFLSFDHTAIFVLLPGSLEIALISTVPSYISGTSSSKRRLTNSFLEREILIIGFFCLFVISAI